MIAYEYDSETPIAPDIIPKNTTHLTFFDLFNQTINSGDIPVGVTHLNFGACYDSLITPGVIPNSVTNLTFCMSYNKPIIPGAIPVGVTHLIFGMSFNQCLNPGCIPNSVTHLTFGIFFDKDINPGDIPDSVTHLIFGSWFNRAINPGCIPVSTTHLTFGILFSKPLTNINMYDEIELNFYYENNNIPKDRIINIYADELECKINTEKYMDEYNIGEPYTEVINDRIITKIKLIPKIISQRKIKSAMHKISHLNF